MHAYSGYYASVVVNDPDTDWRAGVFLSRNALQCNARAGSGPVEMQAEMQAAEAAIDLFNIGGLPACMLP